MQTSWHWHKLKIAISHARVKVLEQQIRAKAKKVILMRQILKRLYHKLHSQFLCLSESGNNNTDSFIPAFVTCGCIYRLQFIPLNYICFLILYLIFSLCHQTSSNKSLFDHKSFFFKKVLLILCPH